MSNGERVDHEQISCAPACGRRSRRLRLPDVLADQQAEADAVELEHGRLPSPGCEIALLVEHRVVRQLDSCGGCASDLAVADQRRGVVDRVADVLRIADGTTAMPSHARRAPSRTRASTRARRKPPMQQQVLGRIAGERELREQHEIGAVLVARTRRVSSMTGARSPSTSPTREVRAARARCLTGAAPWPVLDRRAEIGGRLHRAHAGLLERRELAPPRCPCRPR